MSKIDLMIMSKPMLLRKPKTVYKLNYHINEYDDILQLWYKFKNNPTHSDHFIKSIFTFHIQNNNHILMVCDKTKEEFLCMACVNGEYVSYSIPNFIELDHNIIVCYI